VNKKLKAQQESGRYIHFECIESAVELGFKKVDVLSSVSNRTAIDGLKWSCVDPKHSKCISQSDGFGRCENQCEFCKSEENKN